MQYYFFGKILSIFKIFTAFAKSFCTQRFANATSYFIWQIGRFKSFQFLWIINCHCSTSVFKVDYNQGNATIFPKFISHIRVGNHKWNSLLFFIFEKIAIVILIYKKRFTWLNEVNSIGFLNCVHFKNRQMNSYKMKWYWQSHYRAWKSGDASSS